MMIITMYSPTPGIYDAKKRNPSLLDMWDCELLVMPCIRLYKNIVVLYRHLLGVGREPGSIDISRYYPANPSPIVSINEFVSNKWWIAQYLLLFLFIFWMPHKVKVKVGCCHVFLWSYASYRV